MTRTADQIVAQEVLCNLSWLVATLATGISGIYEPGRGKSDLLELAEQAYELIAPIDDWEEAAFQAGWTRNAHNGMFVAPAGSDIRLADYETWQELCEANDIEPYQREVYEHWAVTEWFADKLEAHSEKVDRDFAGLIVWARTTSGQSIAADYVLERIVRKLGDGEDVL